MSVQRRPDGQWRARSYGPDGKERAKHFPTKRQAQLWEAEQRQAKARGTYVDPSDRTTVSEYAWMWVKSRPHRKSTQRNNAGLVRNHIDPTPLGQRRLNAVRPSEVQSWATGRSELMSPLRLRVLVGLLSSVYRAAELDGLVAKNPVRRIAMPTVERPRVVPLTLEQVMTLADTVPARNRAMVLVQATLGLRLSELLALRAEDVNFLGRTVKIDQQYGDHSRERVETKTPRSKRSIPLPTVTAEALAAHMAKFSPAEDGSIFATIAGKGYKANYFSARIFKPAVDKAGLPKGTSSHDLRHWYASQLLAAGESVIVVAERLGHANGQMVLSVYGHLIGEHQDRTRKAIDSLFEAKSATISVDELGS